MTAVLPISSSAVRPKLQAWVYGILPSPFLWRKFAGKRGSKCAFKPLLTVSSRYCCLCMQCTRFWACARCLCVPVHVLVSLDKILRFRNTFIVAVVKCRTRVTVTEHLLTLSQNKGNELYVLAVFVDVDTYLFVCLFRSP